MHMDFRNHVPMAAGAVDMVHCSWLMNIITTQEEIVAMLMEWDRLVRPGGYIVQYGFRSINDNSFMEALATITRVAKLLRWEQKTFATPRQRLLFMYRKPVRRTSLDGAV